MTNVKVLVILVVLAVMGLSLASLSAPVATADTAMIPGGNETADESTQRELLSPIWGPAIRQWSPYISVLAQRYGLDPDFIAAVIKEESDGDPRAVSYAGAVGLMGVMPTGPGLEWRPPSEELVNPATNLRWGVAILAEVIRQSGGDFYAALAAYSGGWDHVSSRVPRRYAVSVLNNYGRAVAARNGISPEIASQWTLAVKIRRGHVPNESLLVLGSQPVSGLKTYGEHTVYKYVDQSGRAYHVRGYAVPVAVVVPLANEAALFGNSDGTDAQLTAPLTQSDDSTKIKTADRNPHVLLACLPSLSRLRGRASTRWFAPSDCPSWHR